MDYMDQHAYLDNKSSISTRGAFLQKTWPVHETTIWICDGKKGEICLGGSEALARKTNPDVHRTRRNTGLREVRGEAS